MRHLCRMHNHIFRLDEIERASYKNLEIKDYYQLNENP